MGPVGDCTSPKIPSIYPERITSVEPGGLQPEMGRTGRWPVRVGGSSRTRTEVKVEGSGCFWLQASSRKIVAGPQAELKPLSNLSKRTAPRKIVLRSLSSELSAGKQNPPAAPRNQRTILIYCLYTGFSLHCVEVVAADEEATRGEGGLEGFRRR